MTAEERFDRFVRRTDGCWLWTGATIKAQRGTAEYGTFRVRSYTMILAHRFAYERARGAIPDGLTVDHTCRNTLCVNPDHLEVCTLLENIARRPIKTHCKHGHEFTPGNTWVEKTGHRHCRTCHRETERRRKEAA